MLKNLHVLYTLSGCVSWFILIKIHVFNHVNTGSRCLKIHPLFNSVGFSFWTRSNFQLQRLQIWVKIQFQLGKKDSEMAYQDFCCAFLRTPLNQNLDHVKKQKIKKRFDSKKMHKSNKKIYICRQCNAHSSLLKQI